MSTCSLYRHFDSNSTLLYVGISKNVLHRTSQHEVTAEWYDEVATIKVEHYPSLRDALIAEKKAIKSEKPKYNITHCEVSLRKSKKVTPIRVTEAEVAKYRLVVAERARIPEYFAKRFSVEWIADHFGTTPEVIRFVLAKDQRK